MSRFRALPGHRIAVRINGSTLLAVPPMHRDTPAAVRVQVFELVLRRLFGEALELAQATTDEIDHRSAAAHKLAALMAQTPHKNARGTAAAA